jgi:hypothetical protein
MLWETIHYQFRHTSTPMMIATNLAFYFVQQEKRVIGKYRAVIVKSTVIAFRSIIHALSR